VSVIAFAMRRPVATRVATSAPVAVLWLFFAVANFENWRATHRPIGLGATALSRSPRAWAAAALGTFGMLAARPAYHPVGGFELLYGAMQGLGAALAAWAVISLGRSFGIVAANRGIRTGGPYRFVRHPLYSAYIVTETGYLLENPSLRNWCLFGVVMAFQAIRIVEEERTLAEDPAYRDYRERVRSRILPYVL
jgi:protein-S-isoprenylcysteine O-methyltransferase Ste14